MQVRDLAGRVVLEKNGISGSVIDLDVKKCKSGVYMIFFTAEDIRYTARFIKI